MSTPPGSPVSLDTAEGEVTVTVIRESPSSPTCMPPPPAPRRPSRLRRRRGPYWRNLHLSGNIRTQFLQYTPEDVAEIDDLATIDRVFKIYFYKYSRPRSMQEWLYCTAMMNAVAVKCEGM